MYEVDENGNLVLAGDYATEGEVGAYPGLANLNRAALTPRGQPIRLPAAAYTPARTPSTNAFRQAVAMNPGLIAQQGQGGLQEPRARQIAQEEIQRAMGGLTNLMSLPPRPVDGEAMIPLGLGTLAFTSSSGTTLTLSAKPQRGFRGERVVLDIRRVGPTAIASPVILARFAVGDLNQLVGGGALPAEIFAADAFGVRLMLDAAFPGVNVDLTFTIPAALAPGDQIFVSGGIIGRASEIKS